MCHKVPVMAVLVEGSLWKDDLDAVCQRVASRVPVLVVKGTGPTANFIADVLHRQGEQSVIHAAFSLLADLWICRYSAGF